MMSSRPWSSEDLRGHGVGSAAAAGSAATSTTGGFRKLVAQAAAMAIARGPQLPTSYPKLTVERPHARSAFDELVVEPDAAVDVEQEDFHTHARHLTVLADTISQLNFTTSRSRALSPRAGRGTVRPHELFVARATRTRVRRGHEPEEWS